MHKVLLVCEYATLNGGEHSLLAVLDHVRFAGFEFVAAAPPRGPLAKLLAARDIAVIPLETHSPDRTRRSQDELRELLRSIVAVSSPNLVHANSLSMSRLSGPIVAEFQIPSIAHVRDIITLSAAAIADVNRHMRIIAVSQATRNWHVAAGMSAEKTHVVYNGVDLNRFQPRNSTGYLHNELGLPTSVPLVGAIGQIGMRKGLDVLLDAAVSVIQQHDFDAHFVLVGERYSQKQEALEYESNLHDAARVSPLAGRVHFLGVRDDVDRLLNELSLLVHAARQEPLGRVLLEAAAAGVPVIATDVGGTREIFPDDTSARIVASESNNAVAAVLANLLCNPTQCRQMATAARRRAEQAFDVRFAAASLVEHYVACLRP